MRRSHDGTDARASSALSAIYGAVAIFLAVAVPVLAPAGVRRGPQAQALESGRAGETTATTTTSVTTPPDGERRRSGRERSRREPLDPATQAQLDADLAVARTVAKEYPTVAAATKAHLLQAGEFAPELGAHYISYAQHRARDPPRRQRRPALPGGFIYSGNKPTSKIVGLMYISLGDTLPSGFPGPNDHWHRHRNLCIQYGRGPGGSIAVPFAPDRDITRAECDGVRGTFMKQDGVDGARVGRARLGEPEGRLLARGSRPHVRRRHRSTPTRSASATGNVSDS